MLPFSKHVASLGFPLRVVRQSWAAISHDGARVLFTVWKDEVVEDEYIIYPVTERRPGKILAEANDQFGAKEARSLAELAVGDESIQTYGIECIADNTTTPKRSRKSFDQFNLMKLQITKDGRGYLVAKILGTVPISSLSSQPPR